MKLHSDKEILAVSKTLAEKVIAFSNRCRHDEFKDEKVRCYELELIADFARQITGDLEDYE